MRALLGAALIPAALVALVPVVVFAQSDNMLTLDTTPYAPAGYERLLKDYLVRVPLEGGGFETRFDYWALADDPEGDALRKSLRERFLAVEPDGLDRKARYAWALNAYNFLVIDLIVENTAADLPVSISKLGSKPFAIFDEERFPIGGTKISLNALENTFLFLGVNRDGDDLPEELDPRFHFALVCAARGCPSLWPEPYLPQNLEAQLEAATRNALLSPAHLRIDGKTVRVSKIFEWYGFDFGGEPGVIEFLRRYATPAAQEALKDNKVRVLTDIEWDWSLNRPD